MTTYERLKAAWDSNARHDELHRVVEAMAAEGTTRQQLENGLETLLLEVRAAGADDDTEEIINGVWDRLTGWCAPQWHIHARDAAEIVPPATSNGHAASADKSAAPTDV